MLPKSQYMRLSKQEKAAVKRKLGMNKTYQGSHKMINQNNDYGAQIGSQIGSQLGSVLKGALSKVMGYGAYKIKNKGKPSRISGRGAYQINNGIKNESKPVLTNATSPPSFGSEKTIIRHREFISNIYSSTTFNLNKYDVNPGLESTFPWLSGLAINYEKYKPLGMIFEFISKSADALNSTNTALGSVMMTNRYNAVNESIPTSKMQMLQIENTVSIAPSESACCGVECALNFNPLGTLYIRSGEVPSGQSEQFYDICDFYIATEGMQAANVNIGELWITYEIELITPVLNAGQVGNNINYAQYNLNSGVSTSNYFSGASDALNYSNLELTFGTNTITFPATINTGVYQLIWIVYGAASTVTAPTVTFTSGCSGLGTWVGNTLNNVGTNAGATNTDKIIKIVTFQITANSAVLTFSGGTLPASLSSGELHVNQLPLDLGV